MASKKTTTKEAGIKVKENKLIISTHVTEKASKMSEVNAFTFVVEKNATKVNLMDEIKKEYKVTPKYINITNLPRRNVFVRGKRGFQSGIKKAIVFLKKGDTIKLS